MKLVKRFGFMAMAVAMSVLGWAPASASTSVSTMALHGRVNIGPGGVSGGTMGMNAVCAHAAADAQPSVGAEECSLNVYGRTHGSCGLWSAEGDGTTTRSWIGAGNTPGYTLRLLVDTAAGAVAITGTAIASDGSYKTVVGGGVISPDASAGVCTANYGHSYTFVGSLTIEG